MPGGVGGVYVLIFDVVVELRARPPKAKTLDARLTDCGRDGGGCGRDGGGDCGRDGGGDRGHDDASRRQLKTLDSGCHRSGSVVLPPEWRWGAV